MDIFGTTSVIPRLETRQVSPELASISIAREVGGNSIISVCIAEEPNIAVSANSIADTVPPPLYS